ncbi:hypothetical protein SAMN06265337_0645 [Hymenobacter gelipurpurascens]|uniref:Uncharacterized protein n=1 Tax=Hymenobacter gelipurpurascens TaxID=89968 RepID=A0A212T8F9_9BACT|nr:hypothetical protein [Hymenobacter gelipurpurascens]SNC62312.1 hypothetical protein SAMN06265337_0645 [Hymenobacter gelipurpurascens]
MANCTLPASLSAIAKLICGVNFEQIVRAAIVRLNDAPTFTDDTTIKTIDEWVALMAAPDSTKLILTPFFTNHTVPSSEAQFAEEGTNASIGGAGFYTGEGPVKPKGQFTGLPSDIQASIKKLVAESAAELGTARVGIIWINRFGTLIHKSGGRAIPFSNFYIGSPGSEGLKSKNISPFGYTLEDGWEEDIVMTEPSFKALSALDV